MPSTSDRLAALEAENRRIRADLDALRPPQATPAKTYTPPAATIATYASGFAFAMPAMDQLERLHKTVLESYPKLTEMPGRLETDDAPFRRFVAAFRAVGMLGRTKELVDNISLSIYCDRSNEMLKSHKIYVELSGKAFLAAAIAHADIRFRPLDNYPYDISLGLEHRVNTGIPAGEAWRSVLVAGVAPQPTDRAQGSPVTPYPIPVPVTRWSS